MVTKVTQGTQVYLEFKVQRDLLEIKEVEAHLDHQDLGDLMDPEVSLGQRVMLDKRDPQAQLDQEDLPVKTVDVDLKENLADQDHLDHQASQSMPLQCKAGLDKKLEIHTWVMHLKKPAIQ